ncbi:MAG TPA: HAD hydrolase-like protein [Patescibacteria group bacterium]
MAHTNTKMTANPPLILFDIDETLMNTTQFVNGQFVELAKLFGKDAENVKKVFTTYWSGLESNTDFSPEDCIAYLANHYQHNKAEVERVFYHPQIFGAALFPEVKSVLKKLQTMKISLGIYSEGFESFQQRKLQANGILRFFEPNYRRVLRRKMDPKVIKSLPKNTIIIDDKAEVIAFLEPFPNIIPLHLTRGVENQVGGYTLSSLNDLFSILDSLRDARGGVK